MFVSEVLGKRYESWTPEKPVIIHAGTGTGKTYFVLYVLLPWAHENGKRILYLANRKALKNQVEVELNRLQQSSGKAYDETIEVCSYQRLGMRGSAAISREADYIILDEGHYFLSDATFNADINNCFMTLRSLAQKRNAVFVFMTATLPYLLLALPEIFTNLKLDCPRIRFLEEDYINEGYHSITPKQLLVHKEANNRNRNDRNEQIDHLLKPVYDFNLFQNDRTQKMTLLSILPCFDPFQLDKEYFQKKRAAFDESFERLLSYCEYYQVQRDAHNFRPVYCHDWEQIFYGILWSAPADKWLIFVQDKKAGSALLQELLRENIDAVFLTADNRRGRKDVRTKTAFAEVVEKEQFSNRVLIATQVLDNGINLRDPAVKHIAISCNNETIFRQMLGRRRHLNFGNRQDSVNVYLLEQSEGQLRNHFEHTILKNVEFLHRFFRIQTAGDRYEEILRQEQNYGYTGRNNRTQPIMDELNNFVETYAKSGIFKMPYGQYLCLADRPNAKMEQYLSGKGKFLSNYKEIPFLERRLSFDYHQWLALFERAQNEREDEARERCEAVSLEKMLGDIQKKQEGTKKTPRQPLSSLVRKIDLPQWYIAIQKNLQDGQHISLRQQLSWLDISEVEKYDPAQSDNWISEVSGLRQRSLDSLTDYLQEHEGTPLQKSEQEELQNRFLLYAKFLWRPNSYWESKASVLTINKCFEANLIPYKIVSRKKSVGGKQRHWWTIYKR